MIAPRDLAPWASDVRVKEGKLGVTLRRGLDFNGLLSLLKTQDVSSIASLKIPGSVGLSGLRAVLISKGFTSLTSISLDGFSDPDDAVDEIFEAESMRQLRVLKVAGVTDSIDMHLAKSDIVTSLRQLEIRHALELTSLDRYFASKRVASLRFLTLNATGLADAAVLFENPAASNLQSLNLAKCDFDSSTVDALVASRHIDNLRKLNLSYNDQDDVFSSIYRFLRSRKHPSLQALALCGTELEGFDWSHVELPRLRVLDLRDNDLSHEEFEAIVRSRGLPRLERLIVSPPEQPLPLRDIDKRIVIKDRRPAFA